jgi:uncharacterized membrane protein
MERHLGWLRRAVRRDPFTVVEAVVLVGMVVGLVLLLVFADASGAEVWGLRVAAALAGLGPVALVVVLFVHAGHDRWQFVTAGTGERRPGSVADTLRDGWRALETVAALASVVLVLLSLWLIADLPETEAGSTFFFASAFTLLFATVALFGLVAVRIVATAVYCGLDGAGEDD